MLKASVNLKAVYLCQTVLFYQPLLLHVPIKLAVLRSQIALLLLPSMLKVEVSVKVFSLSYEPDFLCPKLTLFPPVKVTALRSQLSLSFPTLMPGFPVKTLFLYYQAVPFRQILVVL